MPVNIIVADPDSPGTLFVGTDMGVFRTSDGGRAWFPVGVGLPRTPVMDVKVHSRILRAATHGRGMWELDLPGFLAASNALRLDRAEVRSGGARVIGAGFTAGSTVRWNGAERPTTFVDGATLDVPLTRAERSLAGRVTVSVLDRPSGAVSNAVDVDLENAPVIHRIDNGAFPGPDTATAAAPCPAQMPTPLAPGMVATLRGRNLSPVSVRAAPSSVGQTLGEAIVEFRSTTLHQSYVAPLLFVSPSRIDFQAPLDVPLGAGLQFDVVQGAHISQKVCVTIEKFSPGLFSVNRLGTGQATATFVSDGKLAAQAGRNARPAKKGELVRLSATGLGPYWQEAGKKRLPVIATPQVLIGGQAAEVIAAEAQQPFAGAYTVTVKAPQGAPSGPSVPVQLTVGGFKSNLVTIAIE
jgi:uncharacterized protein (TIGR03437 family)